MLTLYNKKTASVITDTGQKWNVSPAVLSRVKSAKAPTQLIQRGLAE